MECSHLPKQIEQFCIGLSVMNVWMSQAHDIPNDVVDGRVSKIVPFLLLFLWECVLSHPHRFCWSRVKKSYFLWLGFASFAYYYDIRVNAGSSLCIPFVPLSQSEVETCIEQKRVLARINLHHACHDRSMTHHQTWWYNLMWMCSLSLCWGECIHRSFLNPGMKLLLLLILVGFRFPYILLRSCPAWRWFRFRFAFSSLLSSFLVWERKTESTQHVGFAFWFRSPFSASIYPVRTQWVPESICLCLQSKRRVSLYDVWESNRNKTTSWYTKNVCENIRTMIRYVTFS